MQTQLFTLCFRAAHKQQNLNLIGQNASRGFIPLIYVQVVFLYFKTLFRNIKYSMNIRDVSTVFIPN